MAAKQIVFLQKNKADISNGVMTVTASEGNSYALRALNGNNILAWITTGSTDASMTTYIVNFGEPRRIDTLIFALMNWKSFLVEWYDGAVWTTIADETNFTKASAYYNFPLVHAEQIRVTIRGTQIPDSDKYLYQFIASEQIGRLNGWPVITNPKLDRNLQNTKMLSGKMQVTQNLGGWSFELDVQIWSDSNDLNVVETLYSSPEGFLTYLCGGDDSQFRVAVEPYRLQDILLTRTVGMFSPILYKGLYAAGYTIKMQLAEVTE